MIEEATKNAREAAEKFAKDSGSNLGKIRQGQSGAVQHHRPRPQYPLYQEDTRSHHH